MLNIKHGILCLIQSWYQILANNDSSITQGDIKNISMLVIQYCIYCFWHCMLCQTHKRVYNVVDYIVYMDILCCMLSHAMLNVQHCMFNIEDLVFDIKFCFCRHHIKTYNIVYKHQHSLWSTYQAGWLPPFLDQQSLKRRTLLDAIITAFCQQLQL